MGDPSVSGFDHDTRHPTKKLAAIASNKGYGSTIGSSHSRRMGRVSFEREADTYWGLREPTTDK